MWKLQIVILRNIICEKFFESIQNKSMTDLKSKALEKIRYIQKYDSGWIDRVKEQRANLLNEIENRLTLE